MAFVVNKMFLSLELQAGKLLASHWVAMQVNSLNCGVLCKIVVAVTRVLGKELSG